ncbi:MAG: M60 family metallopeptidase, partial [Planctomycetes bacterium]|nr:M60 family metallopeptidase [Planctomycetota bacterium]
GGGGDPPRVWLARAQPRLQRFLGEQGCEAAVLAEGAEALRPGDVLIWNGALPVGALQVARHVQRGGGLIAAVCPWGTQQLRGPRGFRLHEDLRENAVLGPMGLVFALGYLGEGEPGGFSPRSSRADEVHAGRALQALAAGRATPDQLELLAHAVRALPPQNQSFLGRVRAQVTPPTSGPTPAAPLEDPRARLGLVLAFHAQSGLTPEQVRAAPGAEAFPGAVPADAPRLRRRLSLDGGRPGWRSTGLYVPPGEVVRVTRQSSGAPWTVRVGCHTDALWAQPRWERWPEVTRRWVLEGDALRLASPFGGLLYFEPGPQGEALVVEVEGAVEAPTVALDDPASVAAWSERRAAPGPWAELRGRHLILTVPSAAVRALDDPVALLTWWDRVLERYAELGQRPLDARPQRFVADVQLSAGYMHSGYPIMTHLDVATPQDGRPARVLDLERLRREGSWGHFHELGHNHQRGDWTFAGTGEVTCNLFTLYVMDTVVGIEPWEHPWLAGGRAKAAAYLEAGAPFAAWQRDPGLALVMYVEVQRAFGWEPFQVAFRAYEALPEGERPRGDAEKRDQWLLRLSRAVGRDLGPFFQRWGVPTSEEARARLRDLEPWLPE